MIPLSPKIAPYDATHYILCERWRGVPAGFVTDGASLPRFFWRVLTHPFAPRVIGPAISHDHAYSTGLISRKSADERFRRDLRANGMSAFRAAVFYYAVRAFGWLFYRKPKSTKEDK